MCPGLCWGWGGRRGGCSIQLVVAWQGDRLMMVVVMLLGNTKHLPGTVLSALQIGDLPILQTRKQIQRSSYSL